MKGGVVLSIDAIGKREREREREGERERGRERKGRKIVEESAGDSEVAIFNPKYQCCQTEEAHAYQALRSDQGLRLGGYRTGHSK
jgi:hypothetical protein